MSLDWNNPLSRARKVIGGHIALQGNMNPDILLGSREEIRKSVICILEDMGGSEGHIFNLGHGILPATPYENVKYFVKTVKEESRKVRQGIVKCGNPNLVIPAKAGI